MPEHNGPHRQGWLLVYPSGTGPYADRERGGACAVFPGLVPFLGRQFREEYPVLHTQLFGRSLQNPIGLAAGFDKDGRIYPALFALGFGFVEIGTVTPNPQSGNPRPRLFRLTEDSALINRLGFNNQGAQ